VDWIIDTAAPDAVGQATQALTEHLVRHADDPARVQGARHGLGDVLTGAVHASAGRPLLLHLDWTAGSAVVSAAAVGHGAGPLPPAGALRAADRAGVRALPSEDVGRTELTVPRRGMRTFDAGPPPVVAHVDPRVQGPAAAAVALTAAMETHPIASPPQTAAIAGAILAGAVDPPVTAADEVAGEFVGLYGALGGEAHVVAVRDDAVELAISRCPFGLGGGAHPGQSLCHVAAGLAGQLGAQVRGSATVVLDESIAAGDRECHLQVRLDPDTPFHENEQPHFWPAHAAGTPASVPSLDLSVSLPRESVSVPVVRRLATQALRAFGVSEEDVDDVQLAISEACANVIDHAAETDTYEVKIELSVDRCALTIVDQGSGFDADGVPFAEHDAEMGRGLTLMRALVDNVAFHNEPKAGAVVHMVKTLSYDAAHPMRSKER